MRFLAIDPSSTELGWAVFADDKILAHGMISTVKVAYAERFSRILKLLSIVANSFQIREGACEQMVRWRGRSIPALQVAFTCIKDWAKREHITLTYYNPAVWENSITGTGSHSDKKAEVRGMILFRYPDLPKKISEHEIDAIGIGTYYYGLKRLQNMALDRPEKPSNRAKVKTFREGE